MSKKLSLALLAVLCAMSPSLAQTQSDDVVRITSTRSGFFGISEEEAKRLKETSKQ